MQSTSIIQTFSNIFFEPTKAFNTINERSRPWPPIVLVLGVLIGVFTFYGLSVDVEWFTQNLQEIMLREDPDAEMPPMESSAFALVMLGSAGVASVFMTLIIIAVYALYFFIVGKISGNEMQYEKALALVAWGHLPNIINSLGLVSLIFINNGQVGMEDTSYLSLATLLAMTPEDTMFSTAAGITVGGVWSWVITTLGYKIFTKDSLGKSAAIAMAPIVIIFGGMAAFA